MSHREPDPTWKHELAIRLGMSMDELETNPSLTLDLGDFFFEWTSDPDLQAFRDSVLDDIDAL